MLLSECPCKKDCPERVIGCHGWCEKYKQYRAKVDRMRKMMREDDPAYFVDKCRKYLTAEAKRQKRGRKWTAKSVKWHE